MNLVLMIKIGLLTLLAIFTAIQGWQFRKVEKILSKVEKTQSRVINVVKVIQERQCLILEETGLDREADKQLREKMKRKEDK